MWSIDPTTREEDTVEPTRYPPQIEPNEVNILTSPAQMINFDILSVIFVILWELEAGSEWVVSGVCRSWREAALTIPSLWTRVCPGGWDIDYSPMYLARSHSLPLHATIPLHSSKAQIVTLSTPTDRTVCLKILDAFQMLRNPFPMLERLEFGRTHPDDAPLNVTPMPLEASIYPNLRHLSMGDLSAKWLRLLPPKTEFPPLQSLHIRCKGRIFWKEFILGCAETLISLSLIIVKPSGYQFCATFPRLRHLRIMEESGKITLIFDAPCLQSVYRGAPKPGVDITTLHLHDTKSVTDVEDWNAYARTYKYPGIRTLWVQCDVSESRYLDWWICGAIQYRPLVESIRYAYKPMNNVVSSLEDRSEELEQLIRRKIEAVGRPDINVERFDPEDPHLPGSPAKDVTCNDIPGTEQYLRPVCHPEKAITLRQEANLAYWS